MTHSHTTRNRVILIGILLAAIILSVLILSSVAHAASEGGFVPLADIPSGSKLSGLYSGPEGDLSAFINRIFSFAITIGAMLAILRIAYAGYLYMVSDLWTNKEHAKEILRETILGLLLLLAVYLILNQINPQILSLRNFTGGAPITGNETTNKTTFSFPGGASGSEGKTYYMAPAYKNWCYETRRAFICFENNSSSGKACRSAEQGARLGSDFVSGCKLLGS